MGKMDGRGRSSKKHKWVTGKQMETSQGKKTEGVDGKTGTTGVNKGAHFKKGMTREVLLRSHTTQESTGGQFSV